MKIFVTGVAGQLGHDVMNDLAARGYEAVSYTHLDVYKRQALTMLKDKYSFEPQLVEYGPGLCVEYFEDDWQEKEKQSLDEAAEVLREFAVEYPLGIEMGRFLAASCGKYYTQVKDLKSTGDANYAILDGGIHHLNYFGQRMAMQVPPISIYRAAGVELTQLPDIDYTCLLYTSTSGRGHRDAAEDGGD